MFEETSAPLVFVAAATAEPPRERPFVAIVRTREELQRWLQAPPRGVEWLQAEGLLGDFDAWALAAQGAKPIPLDVIMEHPAEEFSLLYRLVDVRLVRDVRVTVPAVPGFLKAVRLAASLQLPMRILPGQPSTEVLAELTETVDFYLHNDIVDAPIEFFHTLLTILGRTVHREITLWKILEQDPALFPQLDAGGQPLLPADFTTTHWHSLLAQQAECATCEWQSVCMGYFKWPDPGYSCTGIRHLLAHIAAAAQEIAQDLAIAESTEQSAVSNQ
jgi:hypothetical protein